MRRIDLLITQSRRNTENVDFTDETGLSDNDFIQYGNDAQDRLQSLIQVMFSDLYQEEVEIDVVSGQEEYDIPEDCLYGSRIELIEFSRTGQRRDYYPLRKATKKERLNSLQGNPSYYIRRSRTILPQGVPDAGGKFRFTYQKSLPRLDKRRGKVASVTLVGNTITALTLDTTDFIDADPMTDQGYITVVNKDGLVQMKAISITAVDADTGIVTIDGSFVFEDGETIAVGDYVAAGKESTTHSQLPDACERYLLAYMDKRAFFKDSSTDSLEKDQELKEIEADILASFAEPDGDIQGIAVTDTQYFTFEE